MAQDAIPNLTPHVQVENLGSDVPPSSAGTKDVIDDQASMQENRASSENELQSMKKKKKTIATYAIVAVLMIVLGTGTGYGLVQVASPESQQNGSLSSTGEPIQTVAGEKVKVGQVFGSPDTETFKDVAEGYLEAGGVNGEGTHKLLRPGGPTQTVVLTSSVTDLSKLEGMQVRVWGETNKSKSAGWLMDAGRVEVVKTQAQPPQE